MNDSNRVGVIATSFPRELHDGRGRFIFDSCEALASRGYALDIVIPADATPQRTPLPPNCQVHEIQYAPHSAQKTFYRHGVPENCARYPWRSLGVLTYALSLQKALLNFLPQWKAVISHWLFPNAWSVARAQRNTDRPIMHIGYAHSADLHLLSAMPSRVQRTICQGSNQLVFPSERQALKFRQGRGFEQCSTTVLPLGFHSMGAATIDDKAVLKKRLDLNHFTLLWMGRFVPIKDPMFAIHSLSRVECNAGLEVVLAGDGPLRAEVVAEARKHGLQVRDVDWLDGRAKQDYLRASDAFFFTSKEAHRDGIFSFPRSEGMPVTLIEAMGAGLPCIARDSACVRELITDGENGLLASDAPSMAKAIDQLVIDNQLREKLSSTSEISVAHLDWSKWAATLDRMIVLGK